MLKKYIVVALPVLLGGFVLYGTNPDYKQREALVAMTCESNEDGETTMCPLGYGKKSVSGFDRKDFIVYNAGILSYSTYEEKLSSFGILGNVFLTLDNEEA